MGSWRLVSFEAEAQGSASRTKPMGNAPTGYLNFMKDGRMAVVITAEGRKPATGGAVLIGTRGEIRYGLRPARLPPRGKDIDLKDGRHAT